MALSLSPLLERALTTLDAEEVMQPEVPVTPRYGPEVERWRRKVSDAFKSRGLSDADVDKFLYVIQEESGGNPRAANPESSARGLVQMTDVHGIPESQRYDPDFSINWSADRIANQGFTDWGEGVTYQGKPFGALGLKPYTGAPGSSPPTRPSAGGGISITPTGPAAASTVARLLRRPEVTSDVNIPEYGDDYVSAPTGSLRAMLQSNRQGESQYGRIPEVIAEKPLDIATLASYPFAPGWLVTDVAADKASELAGGGLPGMAASLATGIAGPAAVTRGARGLRALLRGGGDDALGIIGREAQDPVTMYQRAREAGFSDEDIARAFGDDAVRLGKGETTREAVTEAAEEARGLEDTANAMRYSKKSPRGSLASRVRGMAERMGGDAPVAGIVPAGGPQRVAATSALRDLGSSAPDAKTLRTNLRAVEQSDPELAAALRNYIATKSNAAYTRRMAADAIDAAEVVTAGDGAVLVSAIKAAAPDAPRLSRGMSGTKRDMAPFLQVGGVVDMPLASFSDSPLFARTFIKPGAAERVLITLEDGAQAINIAPVSKFLENEWLTSGRFEVVSVADQSHRVGMGSLARSVPVKHVVIRQVGEAGQASRQDGLRSRISDAASRFVQGALSDVEGPASSAVRRGDMFTDAAGAERRAGAEAIAREADQADIAARASQMEQRGGGIEAVRQRSMERVAATADEIEAQRLADEAAEIDRGFRAEAGQARAAEPRLQQREIEDMQERVEAADLTRRRDEWFKAREDALAKAAEKAPPEGNAILREIGGIIGLTRTIPTSGDAGGIMRNTAVLGASRPRTWWSTAQKQLNSLFSEADAQTYQRAVTGSPNYSNAVERWGWHVNDWGPGAKSRVPERSGQIEDARIAGAILNAPGVKQLQEGSERSLAIGRNVLGMDVIDEYANLFRSKTGMDAMQLVPNAEMDKQMSAIARVVNHANGWSELAKGKDPFGVFFSLPYTISRFQLIADPLVEALRGNPEASKLALRNLVNFAGANAALLGMLAVTGERTGNWSVNFNPTDGDFGQLKVGSTRFDTLAGLGPIIKTASRLGANVQEGDWVNLVPDLMRFFENKETPFFKAFTDAWVRKQLPDLDSAKDAVMPMMVSSIIDAFKEGENPFIVGAGALASTVGVGANTYNTPADEANARAKSLGADFDSLSDLDRLKVLDPDDKSREGPRAQSRERYTEALSKAGYTEPEKAKQGETQQEYEARQKRNAALSTKNAQVFRDNPDLDVQRWYYENKHGGTLRSREAVTKALELGIEGRKVQMAGLDRVLNETPQMAEAWRKESERIANYLDNDYIDQKYGANVAREMFKKPLEQLNDGELSRVRATARRRILAANPKLDAARAYFGDTRDEVRKSYNVHSAAAFSELQRLRSEYGDATPREGYRWFKDY